MGQISNKRLSMQEEMALRKSDPNWSKNLAACVIRQYKEESEDQGKLILFPAGNILRAAAVLLLSVSLGWFAFSNFLPQEDEVLHGISLLLDGDSYLSSLEE